jgi:hypothetical protein
MTEEHTNTCWCPTCLAIHDRLRYEVKRLAAENAELKEDNRVLRAQNKDGAAWAFEQMDDLKAELTALRAERDRLRMILGAMIADRRINDIAYRTVLPSGVSMLTEERRTLTDVHNEAGKLMLRLRALGHAYRPLMWHDRSIPLARRVKLCGLIHRKMIRVSLNKEKQPA